MADSVVTFLLRNLTQLLKQEANLLLGVEDQVRSLHDELKLINIFLQNSEGKRNGQDMVKELVNQIRDAAYEAEDVIDTFILNAAKQRSRTKLGKYFHSIGHVTTLRNLATKIESIKNKMKEIYGNKDKFGIEMTEKSGYAELESSLHRRRRDVEEDNVVGFVNEATTLAKQLIEGESQRDVISIIGMGGLGKTTLARKIYNDIYVKDHFKCRAWVYVSQEYRTRDLLLSLLECVMPPIEERRVMPLSRPLLPSSINSLTWRGLWNIKSVIATSSSVLRWYCQNYYTKQLQLMGDCKGSGETSNLQHIYDMSDDELKKTLSNCLNGRRYFVVMDDVWNTDLWDEVKAYFPDNLNGSRIMITSRLKEVALHASPNHPHFLPFLNKTESWELFSKKVFRGESCPRELEDLGKQMADSCGGLPLSIVVLGGLLARKEKTHRTWSKMVDHVKSYLTQDKTRCLDILALSYDHLARLLKSCFLYIGVFPEDFEIPARQLIQLWIAEGFIQQIGSRNMEDVAEEYLEELIDRSLIQVARRRVDGGVKTCRIHDLLRDLCISEAARDKFLEVHMNVNSSASCKSRRLSIYCSTHQYILSNPCDSSSVRSFLCFGQDAGHLNTDHWKSLYKGFNLVRVLDLGFIVIDKVPNEIEKLIHLRYLRMNAPSLNDIPSSLCNLWNLQTLDMRQSRVYCLPKGIWKMLQLRHLYLNGPTRLPVPSETDNKCLWNLQILPTVVPDENAKWLLAEGKFPNLTKLGVWSSSPSDWSFASLVYEFHHLQTLKMIKGCLCLRVPELVLKSLTKITLVEMELTCRNIMHLGLLPNLRILKILQASLHRFYCSPGGFPQLHVLQMVKLDTSVWGRLEKDSMINLRRLVIDGCAQLMELPDELWRLTNLRDVEVLWPSSDLATRLQQLEKKKGRNILIYPPPSGQS